MSRKLKLLFVIENAAYGGGEKVFSLLIRSLPAEKFELFCAALPQGRFYEETRDRCRFLPLDLSRRFNFWNIGLLRKMMTDNGIDIAHSQGARADFFCALAAAGTRAKAVSTVAMPVEGFDVCLPKKLAYLALNSFAARKMAAAVTVSGTLEKQLRGKYPLVELIPNPVDLSEFSPSNFDAGPVIERFGLRGRTVMAALGRLEWQKGYPQLLSALELMFRREPELKQRLVCLVGGTGSLEKKLKRQVEASGLSGSVIFCGDVANARDFLGAADIFVMPSLREGQPLALLEAMAMAKPIVATAIPGIKDTVDGGKEALLVAPADPQALANSLLELLRDMPAAMSMGAKARAKAERYGLPDYVAAHEAFYHKLSGEAR
ncbi:MAG: glycosyltransferase family 4 protein [Elusimicrobia bacterium]|nr:glycosyltransferase family 4 protein [Elusimicrobiota bacterium]